MKLHFTISTADLYVCMRLYAFCFILSVSLFVCKAIPPVYSMQVYSCTS